MFLFALQKCWRTWIEWLSPCRRVLAYAVLLATANTTRSKICCVRRHSAGRARPLNLRAPASLYNRVDCLYHGVEFLYYGVDFLYYEVGFLNYEVGFLYYGVEFPLAKGWCGDTPGTPQGHPGDTPGTSRGRPRTTRERTHTQGNTHITENAVYGSTPWQGPRTLLRV